MSKPAPVTLAAVVTRYRREIQNIGESSVELEIRLHDIEINSFRTIFKKLHEVQPNVTFTQTVNSIMDVPLPRGEGMHTREMKIRTITFRNGKQDHNYAYTTKKSLVPPYRVGGPKTAAYIVALSEEGLTSKFTADEGAKIRIKLRASFLLPVAGFDWRVDMTITRQILGKDADTALKGIVNTMFRDTELTPEGFLRLNGEVYSYEVEAEFLGPKEKRDEITTNNVTEVADMLIQYIDEQHLRAREHQNLIYGVALLLIQVPALLSKFQHNLGLKRLLPAAKAITRGDYQIMYPPRGYFLTDKADGERALGVVREGKGYIVSSTLTQYGAGADPGRTVADGELVDGVIYIFDVIAIDDTNLADQPFERRISHMDLAVARLCAAGVPAQRKAYVHLAGDTSALLEREIRAVYEAQRPYKTDGLIFVEPGASYLNTVSNKWKPGEHNTIDFLAVRPPTTVIGQKPYIDSPGHKVYFLFVGISSELYNKLRLRTCPGYAAMFASEIREGNYFPIQFVPSDAPLAYIYQHPDDSPLGSIDGKIVEGRRVGDGPILGGAAWEIIRTREDRARDQSAGTYYGNNFDIAEKIWLNYLDPFPVDQLWSGQALNVYFAKEKASVYFAQTAAISFMKSQRIATLANLNWVVDLGAGKGQDLFRYFAAGVEHLVAVDRDRAALSELVLRKFSHRKLGYSEKRRSSETMVHVLQADLESIEIRALAERFRVFGLEEEKADAVVCNLAMHYFLASPEKLRRFVAMVRNIVKVGGKIILTTMLGDAVHKALEENKIKAGKTWDIVENDSLKYSIRREYGGKTLEVAGQKIGVLLPFSNGEYYEEYLVNTQAVINSFKDFYLILEAGPMSVADILPVFAEHNGAVAGQLTGGDRQWLGLYGEMVFRRDH